MGQIIPEDGEIIRSTFLLEEKQYCALSRTGKIIIYDYFNKELNVQSKTLDVPSAIDDARFSHDQELLAITTCDNQMMLMNKRGMVVQASYDMNQADYGTNEMVNVNWGSKSTQFHGEGMRDKRNIKEVTF